MIAVHQKKALVELLVLS